MKKINAGNLFAGMRSSSVIAGLFIVLIVSIVLLFANFAYLNTQSNHDKQYIGHAGELRVLSQRIAKNATEAAAGKGEAFKLLKDARNDFEKRWNILVNGDESTSLPPSPEAVKPQMDVVQQDWDGLRKNADSILASEQTVLSLHQVASTSPKPSRSCRWNTKRWSTSCWRTVPRPTRSRSPSASRCSPNVSSAR